MSAGAGNVPAGCDGNSFPVRDPLLAELVEITRSQAPKPESLHYLLLARLYAAKYALLSAAMCVAPASNEADQIGKARHQVLVIIQMLGGETE